jgi:RHS repeat-associated protein
MLGNLTYAYDNAGRKTTVGGTWARTGLPVAVPAAGITLNANNQALTFAGTTMTYDLNGNLATAQDAVGTATYTWDVRNRLTSLTAPGFAASFAYDALGRRTGKTVQGVTTNFVYDGLNPVQEKNGAAVTANLLTGLGIDQVFTRTDGTGTRELFTDGLGSTIALANTSGAVQTSYTYEPFGGTTQTGTASSNAFKYTGREDDGTGLYYYRARYYSPRLQRFLSEDPIGFAGGDANLYAYVFNNPLGYIDPTGLAVGDWWDFPANLERAEQIAGQEKAKRPTSHNDMGDAMRHAEWMRRTTKETNSCTARIAGTGHEIHNLLQGQPLNEILMDLRNNAAGREAGRNNTPVNPGNLQTMPYYGYPYQGVR